MSLSEALRALYGEPGEFLARLRRQMRLHGVTMQALADEAGLARNNLPRYFGGAVTPTVETMVRLDEALERLI